MRAKVNAEMEEVEIMYEAKDITWDKESVRRLINKYPEHKRVDKILANLGDDYGHDAIHHLSDGESDDGESAEDAASEGDGEPAVGGILTMNSQQVRGMIPQLRLIVRDHRQMRLPAMRWKVLLSD